MSLICTADRDGKPSSMFQNGIIVHYDTQEHTSQGFFAAEACFRMEPIYEPTGPGTNSKYGSRHLNNLHHGGTGWMDI